MSNRNKPKFDLTGQVFGRLIVIEQVDNIRKETAWLCQCECGNTKTVITTNLRKGITKSCGCLIIESVKKSNNKHGKYKSLTYKRWHAMKERCKSSEENKSKIYKDKGISYDTRWESFELFYEDMGDCPPGLELDRIDPEGNYEKQNCRWANRSVQVHNQTKRCGCSSKYRGVSWVTPIQKWQSQITKDGKTIKIGYFDSEVDAAIAYNNKCQELYGRFAKLNIID